MTNLREEVANAIAERATIFEARYRARDAAGLVDVYFVEDDDGPMACPPNGVAPVRGRAALIELFTAMFDGASAVRLETVEIEASETLAVELGLAHLDLAAGGHATGRYSVCWKKTAAGWRAKIDFFCNDGWTQ